ncbi:MAG: Ig-like domain-containing protein, partial [Clostridia bacterium]
TPIPLKSGEILPAGLNLSLKRDENFDRHATMEKTAGGIKLRFDKSALYQATAVYTVGNVAYEVQLSFYVADEKGIVHLPVTDIELSDCSVSLTSGETRQLSCNVLPAAAYDKAVLWESSDPKIATVSQSGLVSAISEGNAYILCKVQNGVNVADACSVTVQNFLSLSQNTVESTAYIGGTESCWFDGCELTYEAKKRVSDAGITPVWTLERISGDASVLSLTETEDKVGEMVSGNRIYLMRMNHPGTDTYRLTCKAGAYTASCTYTVHVVQPTKPFPAAIKLQEVYEGTINQVVSIACVPTCSPVGSELPAETSIWVNGNSALWSGVKSSNYADNMYKFVFQKPGVYSANILYSGSNYEYSQPIKFRIAGEDGTVPNPVSSLEITPESPNLMVGGQLKLSARVLPEDAPNRMVKWASNDPAVATISDEGVLTGVAAGVTFICATAKANEEIQAVCIVTVEDGLTLEAKEINLTTYLEGETRVVLDRVYLSQISSVRLGKYAAPEWKLERVSGNNLTMHAARDLLNVGGA